MRDIESDFERALQYWDSNGENILFFLEKSGVTLLNLDFESMNLKNKEARVLEDLWRIGFLPQKYNRGIHVFQYSYKKADDQIKTRWFSGKKLIKKGQTLVTCCSWAFMPMCIEASKNSVKPEDQRYVYRMHVWKYAENRKDRVSYSAEIITTWNGSIVRKEMLAGSDPPDFPCKFAFPRRVISKINRCLSKISWPALWSRENYFAWHKMGEGLAHYMGTRRYQPKPYVESLQKMLQQDSSGSGATLLAFTCFSILKEFFPKYHRLEKNATYLEAKKYIPEQIALCIRSEALYSAQRIVNICCGCFYMVGNSKLPIIDGIAVQKNTKKITRLGINEYEQKVLQPAPVLWINRRPEDILVRNGQIISIQVVEDDKPANVDFFSIDLIADLADQIENKCMKQHNDFYKNMWQIGNPLIQEFIDDICRDSEKYKEYFQIDEMDLKREYEKMRKIANSIKPIEALKNLWRCIQKICREELEGCREITMINAIKVFERKSESKCKECSKQLSQQNKLIEQRMLSFQTYYDNAQKNLEKFSSDVSKRVLQKFTFLVASTNVFLDLCVSEQQRPTIRDSLHRGLINILLQQKEEWQAIGVIEQYVLRQLTEGHFARMRGERSECEDVSVWYDVEKKYFLLPAQKYFDGIRSLLPDSSVSKKVFENKLVDEQAIRVEPGEKQLNRTFKVRVVRGSKGPGPSMLQIRAKKFSHNFWENQVVREALNKMECDPTPLRSTIENV